MSTPCNISPVLELKPSKEYPNKLKIGKSYIARKKGYNIYPIDVPLLLTNKHWNVPIGKVVIRKLLWEGNTTEVRFELIKMYEEYKSE